MKKIVLTIYLIVLGSLSNAYCYALASYQENNSEKSLLGQFPRSQINDIKNFRNQVTGIIFDLKTERIKLSQRQQPV